MSPRRRVRLALGLALALVPVAVLAQPSGGGLAAAVEAGPVGEPRADAIPRDPEFGVPARHLGLERRVEMYQWRTAPGGGYERAWSDQAIDASGFAPGHANPPFPLQGRRWLPRRVTIDGHPLAEGVLETLGQWRPFRPGFTALPGNLVATFQPQGDGLGSAENPLDPQIGDIRVTWRDLVLPPPGDRLVLREGAWRLAEGAVAGDAAPAAPSNDGAAAAPGPVAPRRPWWWLAAGAALAIAFVFVLLARRRRR